MVRYIDPKTVTISKEPSIMEWKRFNKQMSEIPSYVVVCHGGFGTGALTFMIPKNTFLLNLTSGGSFCYGEKTQIISMLKKPIYPLLTIESLKELQVDKSIFTRFRDLFIPSGPLYSNATRATHAEYPNFRCSFQDKRDYLGVFNTKTTVEPTDKNSLISVNDPGPYGDYHWFLDDIIHTVYKRTGINNGIFVLLMCSVPNESIDHFTPSRSYVDRMLPNIERDTDKVINLIRKADLEYSSRVPTLDVYQYSELFTNLNLFKNIDIIDKTPELPDPSVILSYARTVDPNKNFPLTELFPEVTNHYHSYPISLSYLEKFR